jgi:ABC-type nitrate/sulfonate/bicarbonate transport system substrate-binding protein
MDSAPPANVYAVELPSGYALWLIQVLEDGPGAAGLGPDRVTVVLDEAAVAALRDRNDDVAWIRGDGPALELVIDEKAYPLAVTGRPRPAETPRALMNCRLRAW